MKSFMHTRACCLVVSMAVAVSCSDVGSASRDGRAQRGVWGSSEASLSIVDAGATIDVLAGNCYGSYGDIAQPIPTGSFVRKRAMPI